MDVRQELLRRFAAPLPEYYTRRIVVFEDDQGGFAADVEQMELPGVRILVMREDEWFTLRRQIESDYAAEDILLYCPKTFARCQDNWLADVFKYSEIFRADYWSLLFEELHIADGVDMRRYARKVGRFFASRDRVAKLGALGKDYRSEQELEIGVMSVLCGLKSASLSGVLGAAVLGAHEEENEKLKAIEKFCGADAFWLLAEKAIGYTGNRDAAELACYLLTSAALLNAPEDAFAGLPGAAAYAQQAYALVSKWLHEDREAMLETCRAVEERYPVAARLQKLDRAALLRVSVYPCADALLIRAALTAFARDGMNVDEVQGMMQARRELPWWGLYAPYADALGALCEMQLFIRAYRDGFHFTDAEEMFAAYASRLCRMDTAYRHLCAAADRALALGLFALEDELKAAVQAAERLYKNGCLAPLGVCWSALLAGQTLETALAIVPRQERFYADHVRGEDARTFVIVSDALRYEVAQELTERLHGRLSGNTVCTAMVGTIPTITPVGMAALLPHKKLTLTEELSVLCDGMRTDASQREAVLRAACPQSAALELGVFRRMTRAQRQEIAREAKVVYLYQDVIDRAGESDGDVFAACETAMSEIEQAMRMLVSELSAACIYVTADHGFIYTRSPLEETDKAERELAAGDVLFEAEVSGYDKEMESLRGEYDAAQKELMELERKNGDVRLKRTEEIWVEAYDALAKSKEDCMTAQTQLEVAAKLAGVTLSGGRLPSGETDETLTAAQKAVDAAQAAQDEAQKKFNSANRLGISENVINYITQSRQLNEKLSTTQEKITALDVLAQQARQVTAPHDGYIVEINVKAGDSYDGKTAALVISSESGDAVLRADTSKIEKKIDKGTQVTVKRDSDKTLTKKVTDSGVNEEGKRYIDVKLTDKDITNLGGGAALFSAAVEMTASYRASSSTTLLPASAVRGSGDSRYVYIVSEESNALGQRVLKVKKQDVKVLSEVGSTVSIQDDLSRQRVAYMEDRAISDGSEVMVYGE